MPSPSVERRSLARLITLENGVLLAGLLAIPFLYGALFHGLPPWRFVPFAADEVYYFKQAESFAAAGWQHGYWGGGREMSPFGGCDVHGCGFMVVTGVFGRLFGWSLAAPVLFNLLATGLAFAVSFLLLPRPRARPALWCAALLLTSGVSIIYLESCMQESLHVAGVLVLAVVAFRLTREPGRARFAVAYLAVASLLALVRFSWIVALPFVAQLLPEATRARRARWAAAGLILAGALYWLAALTRPANSVRSPLLSPGVSMLASLREYLAVNLRSLADLQNNEATVVAVRISWALVLIAVAVSVARRPRSPERTLVGWAWTQLAILTFLQITVYICFNHGDYRVMSIPMLGALIALALAGDRRLLPALFAVQLASAPLALSLARSWNELRPADAAPIATRAEALDRVLARARHPGDGRWCHTVALEMGKPNPTYQNILSMPRGYGVELLNGRADAILHPARFVIGSSPPSPWHLALGDWEGLHVYENPRCGS